MWGASPTFHSRPRRSRSMTNVMTGIRCGKGRCSAPFPHSFRQETPRYGVPVTVNTTELVPTVAVTVAAPAVAEVVRVTEVVPVESVVVEVLLNVPPPVVVHVTVAPFTAVPPVVITFTTSAWVAVPAFTD